LFDLVKKDRNRHKSITINWLAKRKSKLLDAVQTREWKCPQQQARTELLDSEDDGSVNQTASANINGADGTHTEISNNENN
jgi:competence protein ComGF